MGYFEFRLCPKQSAQELATQECFDRHLLTLVDGSTRIPVYSEVQDFFPVIQLPSDVVCDHCVIQWIYTTGIIYFLYFFLRKKGISTSNSHTSAN